jgi:hypothetical protein
MACPYFCPVAPDPDRSSAAHAMLPLGDAWSGVCHADPNAPWQPDAATLYPLCNIGYARSRCARFPAGDGPDAVRFSIRAAEGSALELYYVVERDHLPYAHGALEYTAEADLRPAPGLPAVTRLARAYVSSYFRRRAEAPDR